MKQPVPSLTAKSTFLCAITFLMCAIALLDQPSLEASNAGITWIAKINPDHVSKIELSKATEKTVLNRDNLTGDWAITAPIQHAADLNRIQHLLAAFRREVQADVQVDEGNLKDYQLDASGGIVVELWTDADTPAASFTIGGDSAGGSSFVRVSGDDAVYRARIGGRQRFEHSPADWRNRVVVDRSEADIQGVTVEPWSGAVVHLVRAPTKGETGDGPWTVDPPGLPGWNIDSIAAGKLIRTLGEMRAVNILDDAFDGGFSPPAANITIMDKDGTETTIAIGRRQESGISFARVAGATGVYAIPQADVAPFIQSNAAPKDNVLFQIPEEDIDRFIFYQKKTQVDLARHPETGVWGAVYPPSMLIDVADIQYVVRTLSNPRTDGRAGKISNRRTGLNRPRMVFEVQKKDGSHVAMFVGRHFRSREGDIYFYIKQQNNTVVHVISEATLTRLRHGFGQD
jgi:hypothetical protein